MKAEWVDNDEEGNLYIKLIPMNEDERCVIEQALTALIGGGEDRPASIYGEPDRVIYAIGAGPTGEVLTGPSREQPRLEIRIF
jgi:hypothetical protein